jgi:hypothetical protein
MVAYQREAIELAFLHHRYLRGTAPEGFEELGQQHVAALRALRGFVLWPGTAGRNQGSALPGRAATQGSGGNR